MAFTLSIGQAAPDFDLPGTDGRRHSLASFADATLLVVVFSCNHCPYVIGSEDRLVAVQNDHAARGVRLVAINSNDTGAHPDDGFDAMVERAKEKAFPFPYLRDESQDVARAYGALRTPHVFVFDRERRLRYTGRIDDQPKDATLATTRELRDALDDLLAGRAVRVAVTNPVGCNVKWRARPERWVPPDACDLV